MWKVTKIFIYSVIDSLIVSNIIISRDQFSRDKLQYLSSVSVSGCRSVKTYICFKNSTSLYCSSTFRPLYPARPLHLPLQRPHESRPPSTRESSSKRRRQYRQTETSTSALFQWFYVNIPDSMAWWIPHLSPSHTGWLLCVHCQTSARGLHRVTETQTQSISNHSRCQKSSWRLARQQHI